MESSPSHMVARIFGEATYSRLRGEEHFLDCGGIEGRAKTQPNPEP